jgi:hypothetical protein
MTKEVLKLALEALETAHINVLDDMLADEIQQAITAIKEALAQPEQDVSEVCFGNMAVQPAQQEPAFYALKDCRGGNFGESIYAYTSNPNPEKFIGYYNSPPAAQRTWVGLTVEQIGHQAKKSNHEIAFALGAFWAEAKLKEKNT